MSMQQAREAIARYNAQGFSHPVDEFAGQFAGPIPQPEEPR